jgi:hypothetical protein
MNSGRNKKASRRRRDALKGQKRPGFDLVLGLLRTGRDRSQRGNTRAAIRRTRIRFERQQAFRRRHR